jgi:replicative DNA helicase
MSRPKRRWGEEDREIIEELLAGSDEVEWVDMTSPDFLDRFEQRQTGPVYAIPTPLDTWNRVTGDDGGGTGPARGWLVVIGGNPSYGKTLLALLIARDAIKARERTAFVSLEMHHAQLAARFYAMATGTDIRSLEKGRFRPEVLDEVRRMLRKLFPSGGLLTNQGLMFSLGRILLSMRDLKEQRGVTCFLVDYLQLIGIGDEDEINKQVSLAVACLRAFAVKFEVLVVLLSQFNRQTSSNYHDPPAVQGLHGGMMIEACADQAILLDHSRYTADGERAARTWALLRKNKHGARVDIPIRWDFTTLTIREGMPDEVDQWTDQDGVGVGGSSKARRRR